MDFFGFARVPNYPEPMDLSETHKAQISRYAAFFKGKRDQVVADRDSEKDDFKTDRLPDEAAIFNMSDVEAIVDAYHAQVMGRVRDDLEKTVNLSGVFIAQLLAEAEQANVTLQVSDISLVEDQSRVDQVAALGKMKMTVPPPAQKAPLLPTMGSVASSDPALVQKLQDAEEETRSMKDRVQLMQGEMSGLLKERSALTSELEQVKTNFKQLLTKREGGGSSVSAETQAMLDSKSAECDEMKKEMNKKLADSTQFRELKSFVKKKSDEIRDLRQRLTAAGVAVPEASGDGVDLAPDSD